MPIRTFEYNLDPEPASPGVVLLHARYWPDNRLTQPSVAVAEEQAPTLKRHSHYYREAHTNTTYYTFTYDVSGQGFNGWAAVQVNANSGTITQIEAQAKTLLAGRMPGPFVIRTGTILDSQQPALNSVAASSGSIDPTRLTWLTSDAERLAFPPDVQPDPQGLGCIGVLFFGAIVGAIAFFVMRPSNGGSNPPIPLVGAPGGGNIAGVEQSQFAHDPCYLGCTARPDNVCGPAPLKGIVFAGGERYLYLGTDPQYESMIFDQYRGDRWFCKEENANRQGFFRAPG